MKTLLFVLVGLTASIPVTASDLKDQGQQPPKPLFSQLTVSSDGRFGFVSGQLPLEDEKLPEKFKGKVPSKVSIETAQEAAVICAKRIRALLYEYTNINSVYTENMLAHPQAKILRLYGTVNGIDGFSEPHIVMNAASEFLNEFYPPHSRVAISVNGLPTGPCIEIWAEVEFTGTAIEFRQNQKLQKDILQILKLQKSKL